jgi:hypothetical protein
MAGKAAVLSSGARLGDYLSVGLLARTISPQLVQSALKRSGRQSQRQRAFPAQAVVYYVVALSLYRSVNAQEVLRVVCEGLDYLDCPTALSDVGKSGISQARSRLGEAVMQDIAQEVLQPMGLAPTHKEESEFSPTHWRGLRVVALDGSTVEITDEQANRDAFGVPGTQHGRTGYPQARFSALFERGSGALFGVALGGYKHSENSLARQTIATALKPDMLCLADRGFAGYPLWELARATGAQLLWRIPKNRRLPKLETLTDGSFLSQITISPATHAAHPHLSGQPMTVRVIEYSLPGHRDSEPVYRLITTLTDAKRYPAQELAALYAERWGIETAFADLKTTLKGADIVLRSKTPELVRQEFWGMLLAYQTVRLLMWEVSQSNRLAPERLSFKGALNTVRRKLPQSGAISP